jgi:hypothetical protein
MLEKKESYQYTILPDGQIQSRKSTQIWEDGKMLAETYHREVLEPGQDITKQPDVLKRIVDGKLWDEKTVADYATAKEAALKPKQDITPK